MIFKTDASETQAYLEDTSALRDGHTPGVYIPENQEEALQVLKKAADEKFRLTLSGNGTGTTGGRIPYGDYVLASNKLNRILGVEKHADGTGTARVECGVLLHDLQEEALALGLLYAPDPTESYCFIGATISNNSSGSRSFKYGATRKYVKRLKVALLGGDFLEIKRGDILADDDGILRFTLASGKKMEIAIPNYDMPKTSKHTAGYFSAPNMDLIDLFIGSEGTLGFVLEADLHLIPKPEKIIGVLAYFSDKDDVIRFVDEARERTKKAATPNELSARALEFFDANSLDFLRQKYPNIPAEAKGAIFFEQEVTAASEDELLGEWFDLMEKHHALLDNSWAALSVDEQRAMREFRHSLPVLVNEWLSKQETRKISTDMAVPQAQFQELFNLYETQCQAQKLPYILFGHIGDSHLHLNILPKNMADFHRAKDLYDEFMANALAMGGTISAEHGVGKLKSKYLVNLFGEAGIREMVRIKKIFDPDLMLNVGNLIPKAYLH
ncbi:D-lactate dehydrogenase (cytochrome) [Chloroherpeton thalassium ATCC 35110]|uniref:D-lactate dehydrogenase (Cytochrome) n=1 Tax=Chloroherpeton thalassium (strain ATCC 35110 / GB-78) TaxID=517418 RepID=B3QX64_CHLT3|nr:FAD-binding oxidoreductase [Chloroherpeton thalassium]ACF14874.1 D-lactate dehydrogenase (cytochrome) [Chloroherpeton thalassium ATCC 35110]